jgi:epoxide hydrolase-like predicted phosphatase
LKAYLARTRKSKKALAGGSSKMIDTIIFDLGGVLVSSDCEKVDAIIARALGINIKKFRLVVKEYKGDLTKGRLILLDFYSNLIKKLKIKDYAAEDILKIHMKIMDKIHNKINKKILFLIKKLRRNYRVVCLVNTELEIASLARKKGLYNYFYKAYVSTEMGMKKPDSEIYLAVLKDLNCKPQNALFIDDKKENIKGAEKIGIKGILYRKGINLKKELEKIR